ncbi:hypothetical protein HQ563_12835 [bacterium]|nr:hypothetical protein [bacterium]
MKAVEGMKRRALLLSLIDAMSKEGSWCGETHVQKCVYFVQDMLDVPMGFDFILYKHGPFSFDLRDELTAMRADDLLQLDLQPPYGPSLRPGPLAEDLIGFYPKTIRQYKPSIEFLATHVSTRRVSELERLGTALYVTKKMNSERSPEPVDQRANQMHSLKPHVSKEEARIALRDVDTLISESESLRD